MSAATEEARRQMNICNACRYCEGYCAVYPALERRIELSDGDLYHLANLCHDCRACLSACMYAAPHEFALNPPKVFSELRRETYDGFLGGDGRLACRLRTPDGALAFFVAWAVVVTAVFLFAGAPGARHLRATGAPYEVVPYAAVLVLALVPFVSSLVALALAGLGYWRATAGDGPRPGALALARSLWSGASLTYLRGGGAGCVYERGTESPLRRWLHFLVFYGFLLCLVSTVSAGISQDLLGHEPPYPVVSVPVLSGLFGGTGLVFGALGLLGLKRLARAGASDAEMVRRDQALALGLAILGVTGLATLMVRSTAAYPVVFVCHLAVVLAAFSVACWSKFVHFVFRLLALAKDAAEAAGGRRRPRAR